MIPIVLGGLALMRMRRMVETSSSNDSWKEWELRAVVFFSLVLQMVLICLGKRRKYITGHWIRAATWSAYLLADTVAIYALGMISTLIGQIHQDNVAGNMDPHAELSAFWAPFLLLHLGGPDTITANALEDNELWLRHLLALFNQTGITFYVLVMSWMQTRLAIIAFLMTLSGLLKYGERVWALRAASSNQFKNSIANSRPQLSNKIEETYLLKEAEGYDVIRHNVIEVREVWIPEDSITDLSSNENDKGLSDEEKYKRHQGKLVAAWSLANTFQRLFADLLFSSEDRDTSLSLLKDKHCDVAFKIIEMELALIYDLFYTKAKTIYSRSGFFRRLIILFFICVALALFSLSDKQRYSRMDLGITFLLLGGAIFLEIYALSDLLFSDRVACWLIDHKSPILDVINRVQPLWRRRRWSNSIGQCSLLSFSLKEENLPCRRFLRLLRVDEEVAKYLYVEDREELTEDLKVSIMSHLKDKAKHAPKLPLEWTDRGGRTLNDHEANHLKWSVEMEFDMSILVWHIATELCCHPQTLTKARNGKEYIAMLDRQEKIHIKSRMAMSKHLSRYMLFLLVCHRSMLPMGMGSIRFRDVYEETSRFFKQHKSNRETNGKCIAKCLQWFRGTWCCCCRKRIHREIIIAKACDLLRTEVKTKFNLSVTKEDKAKYVLFQGCRLAAEIEDLKDEEKKWKILSEVWVEMLFYAANRCKGRSHASQMRRGGELITHVWFLMAHFGFTDHFQIPHAPSVAELVVKSK